MSKTSIYDNRPTWNNMRTPKVMERMLDLYETKKWHDCVFKLWDSDGTGEELIYAHNMVLASCSPVFEALCFGPLAVNSPIEVPDIDPLAFKMMLKFIYTDNIEFSSVETACNVLNAARKYLIYSLAGLSISYILSQINESNCLQLHSFGSFTQEERLIEGSWNYICSHLDEVSKHHPDVSLTKDLVKNLVKEEALNGSEASLFKICIMWAETECDNKNLEITEENLRRVLVEADILSKIRWLTFTKEEFEEGPKKSGILTNEEIKFISESISHICLECKNQNENEEKCNCKIALIDNEKGSDLDILESKIIPPSINCNFKPRKKIQLKKFYCHRVVEHENNLPIGIINNVKVNTYVVSNKSVRLTAIFLNAKMLPIEVQSYMRLPLCAVERDYNEKILVSICDSNNKTLLSTLFYERVNYGSIFKISLPNPVILKHSKEYNIKIDLCDPPDYYLFGLRNSISKFPSGLCVSFREQIDLGDGKFRDGKYLSILSGIEVWL